MRGITNFGKASQAAIHEPNATFGLGASRQIKLEAKASTQSSPGRILRVRREGALGFGLRGLGIRDLGVSG